MKNYILLVGGGKVGYHLAAALKREGWQVGLIEADAGRADKIVRELGITVINGDATDLETLGDADAGEAQYLVAMTGSDETNLAVCQMAKRAFGVAETIARVINPKNERIYRLLGIDATISTTAMAAETIGKALPSKGMRLSQIFSGGDVEMAEVELKRDSPVIGKAVTEVDLPQDCLLIALIRDGVVQFPRGRTVFAEGDRVFALAKIDSANDLRVALIGGRK